mgnify:CR=1 FL=1
MNTSTTRPKGGPFCWAIKYTGVLTTSAAFDDWSDCYDDYCVNMLALQDSGHDLSKAQWRGVYTARSALAKAQDHIYEVPNA